MTTPRIKTLLTPWHNYFQVFYFITRTRKKVIVELLFKRIGVFMVKNLSNAEKYKVSYYQK